MSVPTDSPEGEWLDVLTTLVEAYESEYCPPELSDQVRGLST